MTSLYILHFWNLETQIFEHKFSETRIKLDVTPTIWAAALKMAALRSRIYSFLRHRLGHTERAWFCVPPTGMVCRAHRLLWQHALVEGLWVLLARQGNSGYGECTGHRLYTTSLMRIVLWDQVHDQARHRPRPQTSIRAVWQEGFWNLETRISLMWKMENSFLSQITL